MDSTISVYSTEHLDQDLECLVTAVGKISISELHFFLNIRTVLDKIIINKRINYLISDGKSSITHSNNMYYFHSRSANGSQFSQ